MTDSEREGFISEIERLRKRVEELSLVEAELDGARRFYRDVTSNIPGVVYQFRIDTDGSFSFPYVNERVIEVFGVSSERMMADSSEGFKLIVPDDLPVIMQSIRKSAESFSRWSMEFRIVNAHGKQRWVQGSSDPVRAEDGSIIWNGVFIDITERKKAEEALRRSELEYRSFFESTGTAVIIIEPDTTVSLANNEFARITGYGRDEIEHRMKWTEFVDPADLDRMIGYHRQRRIDPASAPAQYEFRLMNKSGEIRNIYISVAMVPESARSIASFIDITDRIRIENELRESERKHRDLANLLPETVFELDSKLAFTFVNDAALKLFGYGQDVYKQYTALDLIIPEDHEKIFKNIALREQGNNPTDHEYRAKRKDGTVFPASIYVSAIRRDGRICGFRGIVIDNTSQKRHEDALREIEDRYRTLVDTSPDSIVLTDMKGTVILANRMSAELHGFSGVKEMVGIRAVDLYAPSSREMILGEIRKLLEGGELKGLETEFIRKDGSTFPVELSIAVIRDSSGTPYALIGISRDIAERKLMEEEIQKRQKLDSLGVLAGGIAHDFNNILTSILGNISLAKASVHSPDVVSERLGVAENACYQAKNLTLQLLTFSKGGVPVRKVLSVADILKETVQFSLSGSAVRPVFRIQDDLMPAELDEGQIRQVIHNLIINTEEAMPDGGIIEISAENVTIQREDGFSLKPGRYIKCSVRDEGTGIPSKYLKKVFDPYFSTKQKGSGLGLAVSYSIISKHGGSITAESREGEGSTFSFYLPAAVTATPEKNSSLSRAERDSAAGKILIMDDDDLILSVAGQMLKYLGYRYMTAKSGEEAVSLYGEAMRGGERFAAVIMDLTVPGGMGGRDAIKKLHEIDPGVRGIVSSGYSNDPVIAAYREHGFLGVINKPYVIDELSAVLRNVIKGTD